MRLDFIACKYTHFIQYGKTMEYFFVKKKGILVEHVFLYIFPLHFARITQQLTLSHP